MDPQKNTMLQTYPPQVYLDKQSAEKSKIKKPSVQNSEVKPIELKYDIKWINTC